jgi:hypothetical protein
MKSHASLPLRIEAELFLGQNGIVWTVCEVESAPDGEGHITLSPAVCLSQELFMGETSRIVGLICAYGPAGLFSAQQTLHFPGIDPVQAARELLVGLYEALFTTDGRPLVLVWAPAFQERLRHQHHGPALASHALRSTLLQRIAEAEGPSDEDLRY